MISHVSRASGGLVALKLGASALALTVAVAAQAQTATPEQNPEQVPTTTSAGGSGTKKPVSGAVDAAAQSQADQSTVTPQDGGTPAGEADGEIVVTGIRQSLANAQTLKRNADTVVDAITAEDIGALPDRSVNEALQRVPGVAISRFAAPGDSQHFSVQGSGVTIRGLGYVRGEFNGRDTFSVNSGREIGFNDIPTELVGSVEVFKNLTADLVEGGISANVNINTRKPFDTKDTLIYLSGGVNYGDFEGRSGPFAVGLFSKQWETGGGSRFGLLASATYARQYSRADSVFVSSMLPRYNDDRNDNGRQDPGEGRVINAGTAYQATLFDRFPVPAGFDRVYAPLGAGFRTQDFDRERIGYAGAAQFENASGNLLITGQFLRAESTEEWIEHTTEPSVYYGDVTNTFPAGFNGFAPIAGQTFQNYTFDDDGVFTSGTVAHTRGVPFANGQNCDTNGDGVNDSTYCPLNQFVANSGFVNFSNRYFYTKSVTQDQAINVKWSPAERLHLNFDAQYVTSDLRKTDSILNTATFASARIDLTGNVPQVNFLTPGVDTGQFFADPNRVYLNSAFTDQQINDGDEWAFRADAAYDLSETGFLRELRVGGRYADRQQTVRDNDYNNWGAVSDTWTGGGPAFFSRLAPGDQQLFNYANFYRGDAGTPPASPFVPDAVLSNNEALMDLLRRATVLGGGNYVPVEDRDGGEGLIKGFFRPGEIYDNREKTWAAYGRITFGSDFANGMKLSGNVGVRWVRTRDESVGAFQFPQRNNILPVDNNPNGPPRYNTIAGYCAFTVAQQAVQPSPTFVLPAICTVSPEQQAAALAFSNGASQADIAKQTYDNWLPSFNVRLDLTPEFLMRFAASRAISRPNFGDLRNFVGIGPAGGNTTGVYGFSAGSKNPFLRPVKATQLDLTAEWYFAKVGSLTGTLFYKRLSNIILDNFGFTRSFTNNGQTYDVQVNGPANAKGNADIKGAEISYQQTYDFLPGFLRGFGTQATFTYIDPGRIPNAVPANAANDGNRPPLDVTGIYETLPLAGLSKYNFNVAGFYELSGIQARIAYSWRSKFLLTNRDCCFPFLPVFSEPTGQADGSLFYTVNQNFKIGLQVQNIFDQTTRTVFRLNADGLEAKRSYFKSDRQYQLSVRLTL